MDVLRDTAHIGMFEPQDLEVLKGVFTRLKATGTIDLDEARSRSLARSMQRTKSSTVAASPSWRSK